MSRSQRSRKQERRGGVRWQRPAERRKRVSPGREALGQNPVPHPVFSSEERTKKEYGKGSSPRACALGYSLSALRACLCLADTALEEYNSFARPAGRDLVTGERT